MRDVATLDCRKTRVRWCVMHPRERPSRCDYCAKTTERMRRSNERAGLRAIDSILRRGKAWNL